MKKLTLLLLCCSMFFPLASFAQRGDLAIPEGANLQTYPILNHHGITVKDQVDMHLRLTVLREPWTGYNWYRDKKRFVLETLPAWTMVWVDEDDMSPNPTPIYKDDCGNRLVELSKCPECSGITQPSRYKFPFGDDPSIMASASIHSDDSKGGGFFDDLTNFVKGTWHFAWLLFLLLLGLFAIVAAGYVFYRLLKWLFGDSKDPGPAKPKTITSGPASTVAPIPAFANSGVEDQEIAAVPASAASAATVTAPAEDDSPKRRFFTCYFGGATDQIKVVSGGLKEVHVEQSTKGNDFTTTIRVR